MSIPASDSPATPVRTSSRRSTLPTSLLGERVHAPKGNGNLVGHKVVPAELTEFGIRRVTHDKRDRHLTQAVVGKTDDRHLAHAG